MAPAVSKDDQFLFLVSCIKHASNGKPDFNLVAKERGIVTGAAAQKRWVRLLKAHGISLGGVNSVESPPKKSVKRSRAESQSDVDEKIEEESDEEYTTTTPLMNSRRKRAPAKPKKRTTKKVKREVLGEIEVEAEDNVRESSEEEE